MCKVIKPKSTRFIKLLASKVRSRLWIAETSRYRFQIFCPSLCTSLGALCIIISAYRLERNGTLTCPTPPHRRSGWCDSIMSRRQCVFNCKGKFVLFSLPKNEDQKNQWLKFIFTTIPEQYNKSLLLCSQHFTDDCFSNLGEYSGIFKAFGHKRGFITNFI